MMPIRVPTLAAAALTALLAATPGLAEGVHASGATPAAPANPPVASAAGGQTAGETAPAAAGQATGDRAKVAVTTLGTPPAQTNAPAVNAQAPAAGAADDDTPPITDDELALEQESDGVVDDDTLLNASDSDAEKAAEDYLETREAQPSTGGAALAPHTKKATINLPPTASLPHGVAAKPKPAPTTFVPVSVSPPTDPTTGTAR